MASNVEAVGKQIELLTGKLTKSPPDIDGVMKVFAEDCKILPPGAPMKEGLAECRKIAEEFFTSGLSSFKLLGDDIQQVNEDTIISMGRAKMIWEGTGERRNAKNILVWKKIDGDWKIFWDIYNFDN